jgi:phosphatidylserine/phosphatidylglycerophosphate/cardiolipin synthase-like enzyme
MLHTAKVGQGKEIKVLLLPSKQDAVAYIRNLLGAAKKNITLIMSEITDWKITQALILSHKRGIEVSVLTRPTNENSEDSQISRLQKEGVNVVFSKNDNTMHQRCMVIDSNKVIVGSNNFTLRGLKDSAENMVVLDDPIIAKAIEDEFIRCSKAISYRASKWGLED